MIQPMKISEYARHIASIAKACKANGIDPECYYSSDEEGNSFDPVYGQPGIAMLDEEGYPLDYDPSRKEQAVIIVN